MSIIFIALGLKALESVSDAAHHDLYDALAGVPLVALYSGVSAHRLGHVGFRRCNVGSRNGCRTVRRGPAAAHLLSAWRPPAIAALAIVAVLLAPWSATSGAIRHRAR